MTVGFLHPLKYKTEIEAFFRYENSVINYFLYDLPIQGNFMSRKEKSRGS
jgi:hypothetical protein